MVACWGMDPDIGPIDLWESEDHPFPGQLIGDHRARVETLVERLEGEGTLDSDTGLPSGTVLFRTAWHDAAKGSPEFR